ncbi:putative retrotransposon hot spot protein (RHS) [Trypanosoma cruzi]|uniref:Putative retrotransposon hot spot protein (RHS) n=1 Tax=Trypanosoma cruzi TaxID=5693 RepID=A0A2V2UMQ6_TRYCR|nr:putative retrotransposon hot spot protein (RHS) [Trypanosoma cruzi]
MGQTDKVNKTKYKRTIMRRCCGRSQVALLRGGGPRLLHRQALQCGCMAHRPPRRASAAPNAIGTAGRDSREYPLESQRHLLAAVGRCEWDASPHGCCDGTSPWLL